MIRICFVCSGNICRSPSAEIVMRSMLQRDGLADRIEISSAGLGDWHVGEGADPRSLAELTTRGYDGSQHRAQQFTPEWFDRLDLVVAMDASHVRDLRRIAPPGREDSVQLLMSFAHDVGAVGVPDPYYGGPHGFAHVLDMIEAGCAGLLDAVRPRLRL